MAYIKVRRIAAICVGAIATTVSVATTPVNANEFTKILADVPLNLPIKTLDSSWQRFQLNQESLAPSVLFGISGILESALRTNVYYTQGQTVTISKQQYLVVYRPEGSNISLTRLFNSRSKTAPQDLVKELTPNSKLVLSLINLNKIESLQDIQPFNLQKEIKESKQAIPKEPKAMESRPSPSKPASPKSKP